MIRIAALATLAVASFTVSVAAETTVPLVWHVESDAGDELDSRDADTPINPASVVKLATTLWALEELGPDHRFVCRFAIRGTLDEASGVLDGDLLVEATADPDFHVENAYLVARALNAAGLGTVRGRLLVDDRFWIGWEGGSESKTRSGKREVTMATRLRDALDPARWDRRTQRLIREFRSRAGIEGERPAIVVEGAAGDRSGPLDARVLVEHRSNPLRRVLKRFNAYSNNDIERLGESLGTPSDLAGRLRGRWDATPSTLSLETLSGLGSNRMTARQVVRLLRELDATCDRLDLRIEDLLPSNGCDPGTLKHFPQLSSGDTATLVAKTGTLIRTDGGVAVLAGVVRTAEGRCFFCVVAPSSGKKLAQAREAEERWVLELIRRQGGASPGKCGDGVTYSDDDAQVIRVEG